MKKKFLITLLFVTIIVTFYYLQFSRKATISNVITSGTADDYTASITITMNQLISIHTLKAEHQVTKLIVNNEFDNLQFSYDVMGYPREILVTVYSNNLTKKLGIPAYRFVYAFSN